MNSTHQPVVLIEGLDGVGKSTLVNALASRLDATVIASPPSMPDPRDKTVDLRQRMDVAEQGTRREYYRSSNFHASLLAEEARLAAPVILDRYWPSTASFAVLDEGAPEWEPLGAWPQGLVIPDVVFLLTVNEDARRERMEDRGLEATEEEERLAEVAGLRADVLEALRCFDPIEIDTSDLTPQEVMDEVMLWLDKCEIITHADGVEPSKGAHIEPQHGLAEREQA